VATGIGVVDVAVAALAATARDAAGVGVAAGCFPAAAAGLPVAWPANSNAA